MTTMNWETATPTVHNPFVSTTVRKGIRIEAHVWELNTSPDKWIGYVMYHLPHAVKLQVNVGIGQYLDFVAITEEVAVLFDRIPTIAWDTNNDGINEILERNGK